MKRILLALIPLQSFVLAQKAIFKPIVKPIVQGNYYNCLDIDKDNNLWIGTYKKGLWKAVKDNEMDTYSMAQYSTDATFNQFNLLDVVVDNQKAIPKIYVGHNGLGGTSANQGGITLFAGNDLKGKRYNYEIDAIYGKELKSAPKKNDGLPSRNCKDLSIDINGSIWAAHGYHDLTVSGTNPQYYVIPGGIGFKRFDQAIFDNVATKVLPYPGFTINPALDGPGHRQCFSVGIGTKEVWASNSSYIVAKNKYYPAGITKFDLQGNVLGRIDYSNTPDLPFTNVESSPIAMAVHFTEKDDVWMGFNKSLGFAIYSNAASQLPRGWKYVSALKSYDTTTQTSGASLLLPQGIRLNTNMPDIISSSMSRVFIGTRDGLLVYNGNGAYDQDSSYQLITTADGLSSNSIVAVVAKDRYAYVVTLSGVDRLEFDSDIDVFNVVDPSSLYENRNGENYRFICSMKNDSEIDYGFMPSMPKISADGSRATIFRYYTSDFDGFYSNQYEIGLNDDFDEQDTEQYGMLRMRPSQSYEDDSKKYVDIIFTHPKYIDSKKIWTGSNEVRGKLSIKKRQTSETLFEGYFAVTYPPVLLIHGVWSDIEALKPIENKLLQTGYKPYQILKVWRTNKEMEEQMFYQVKNIIPGRILQLLSSAASNGMSAGKVNVIGHSRGGLYARAYIEELYGVTYRDNINSLITLNSPHAGSQLAHLVLDKREVHLKLTVKGLPISTSPTLGDIFGNFIPIENERKGHKNGAKGLLINRDFIAMLNAKEALNKLKEKQVPMHLIATNFDMDQYCIQNSDNFKHKYCLLKSGIYPMVSQLYGEGEGMFDDLFNKEKSDLIVPQRSMEAGLGGTPYVDRFEGYQITHSADIFDNVYGVTVAPVVLNRIVELLKENIHASSSSFTKDGINPPDNLYYEFLKHLPGPLPSTNQESRIAAQDLNLNIEYKGGSLKEADTLRFKIVGPGLDNVLVVYENSTWDRHKVFTDEKSFGSDTLNFDFAIPANYFGNMDVIAYGTIGGKLAAIDTLHLSIGLNTKVELKSLWFEGEKDLTLRQNEFQGFTVKGMFSDSLVRVINSWSELSFRVEDTTLVKLNGYDLLRAKPQKVGRTSFFVGHKELVDQLEIFVEENLDLSQTFISDFSVHKTDKGPMLNWTTALEYQTKSFVLERRKAGHTDFDSITTVAGKGYSYDPFTYAVLDSSGLEADSLVYRIKVVNTEGGFWYSDVVAMAWNDVVTTYKEETLHPIKVYPNPTSDGVFYFQWEGNELDPSSQISIMNSAGAEEYALAFENNQEKALKLDLKHLNSGLYYLRIKNLSRVTFLKLIIAK